MARPRRAAVAETVGKPLRRTRKAEVEVEVEAENSNGRRVMTDEHKAALAEGREHGRAVRRYLEALQTYRPRRGRPVNTESLRERLQEIEESYSTVDPLTRLQMVQERMDIQARLEEAGEGDGVDLTDLEEDFVAAAGPYSERKGITYQAWRQVGVPAPVLKRAGVPR